MRSDFVGQLRMDSYKWVAKMDNDNGKWVARMDNSGHTVMVATKNEAL